MDIKALKNLGIVGKKAPELKAEFWIDGEGKPMNVFPKVSDYEGKLLVMYCFQHHCHGCHEAGFPTLKVLQDHFEDHPEIAFLVIQSVFEDPEENNADQLRPTQEKYGLTMPFGHDTGSEKRRFRADMLFDYRIGGTPWFIIVDKDGTVILNTFHIESEKAIVALEKLVM